MKATLIGTLRNVRTDARRVYRRIHEWYWRELPAAVHLPYEVVTHFDVHAYERELIADLSGVLLDAGIEHLILDQRHLMKCRVAIERSDARQALRVLAADDRTRRWWMAPVWPGHTGAAIPVRGHLVPLAPLSGLALNRNLVSPSGVQLVDTESGVLLEFWTRQQEGPPSTGGGRHEPGTIRAPMSNGILDYTGPGLWAMIQAHGHRLPERPPHVLLLQEPVDLVYTWVDGDDPAWQARKAAALGVAEVSAASVDATIQARFENRDELKYSLRSVEMFANWVNRIWIVTDQQVPVWLRQDDRLRIVDHREIFADPAALPVYNSHAIESQLHHIPGLAEHYLYLNDDMLFGARVEPEDFFHGNGVSKFFTSPALIDVSDHGPRDLAVTAAAKNNRDLVRSEFGRTITNKLRHTPQPQVRTVIEDFEQTHPDLFDQVMRSRLRHASNYSLPSSLSQYYAFATGRAVPGRLNYSYVDLAAPHPEEVLETWLRNRQMQTFCVNDSGGEDPATRAATSAALREFFESYFPLPSRWEKA